MKKEEIKAWRVALFYCKQYCDCNPDVGMGPNSEMLLDRISRDFNVIFFSRR
jgi:hypothetical protein